MMCDSDKVLGCVRRLGQAFCIDVQPDKVSNFDGYFDKVSNYDGLLW